MGESITDATQAGWEQAGTGITGSFFAQNIRPGGASGIAMLRATNGTTPPTEAVGQVWLQPLVAFEGDSLAAAFGVAGANTLWVRGFDGPVRVSVTWA